MDVHSSSKTHIFPVIDKWIIGVGDEVYVVAIIKLLGLMSRCFAISVLNLLSPRVWKISNASFRRIQVRNFISVKNAQNVQNDDLPVAEAVTDVLVHFRRLNPEGVITILANWTPRDYKVTKSCVRTLKKITLNLTQLLEAVHDVVKL